MTQREKVDAALIQAMEDPALKTKKQATDRIEEITSVAKSSIHACISQQNSKPNNDPEYVAAWEKYKALEDTPTGPPKKEKGAACSAKEMLHEATINERQEENEPQENHTVLHTVPSDVRLIQRSDPPFNPHVQRSFQIGGLYCGEKEGELHIRILGYVSKLSIEEAEELVIELGILVRRMRARTEES